MKGTIETIIFPWKPYAADRSKALVQVLLYITVYYATFVIMFVKFIRSL